MKVQHDREYIYHQIPTSSVPIVERIEYLYENNDIKFDSNNNNVPLYIEAFTARTLSSRTDPDDKVFFRGFDNGHSLSGSWFWADNIFYQLQSQFFKTDAYNNRSYITNPWTGASVSSLHCIAFSNHLFKDKLDSFNSDIIISITGDLENSWYIGYSEYDTTTFIYTSDMTTMATITNLTKAEDGLKVQEWDDMELDYVYIQAKVFYNSNSFYRISGVLFKDYGLIMLFNDIDSWPQFETARLTNKNDSNLGSTANPAVWWNILEQRIKYNYVQYYYDYKVTINIPWDRANYTSNQTVKSLSGNYMFNKINDLNELAKMEKTLHPKTYISTISLMNDKNDVMAICKFPHPIKKDFLNEYDFNIRIRR